MLGWDRYRFDKKRIRRCYVKFVFSHPVGSVGHKCIPVGPRRETLMHYSSCSGGTSTDSIKSASGSVTRTCAFSSGGIYGSCRAFGCIQGTKCRCTIFHVRVGLLQIRQVSRQDTLRRTYIFASGGICESRRAFRSVRGTKHRHTIFMLGWDWYGFDE
jgi:hypothetical protein